YRLLRLNRTAGSPTRAVSSSFPVAGCQSRTAASKPTVTRNLPVRSNSTVDGTGGIPVSVRSIAPEETFHIDTFPSTADPAIRCPSGCHAASSRRAGPGRTLVFAVARSITATPVALDEVAARLLPSNDNRIDLHAAGAPICLVSRPEG